MICQEKPTLWAYPSISNAHTDAEELDPPITFRVFHHYFKQSQTELAVLNVFQDPKSKILEKLDRK